jgi:hypothetical protein
MFLELPGPVQVTMIGDRERRHLELLGARDEAVDAIGAIEQRVFGMAVEMDEGQGRFSAWMLVGCWELYYSAMTVSG